MIEQEFIEHDRILAEERAEAERLEQERLAAEALEQECIEQEQNLAEERAEAERLEQERSAAEAVESAERGQQELQWRGSQAHRLSGIACIGGCRHRMVWRLSP